MDKWCLLVFCGINYISFGMEGILLGVSMVVDSRGGLVWYLRVVDRNVLVFFFE